MNVDVHGSPTAEETAAVLAVLARVRATAAPSGYAVWRATRRAALRATRPATLDR